MNTFTLLYSSIIRSSIWVQENKETRLVWVTLLALKDRDGNVYSSMVGLADSAKVSPEECREALDVLLSPDPNDTSGVEEGRRIREIRGGWQIINHDLYRFSTEARREMWRQQQAMHRAKKSIQDDPVPKRKRRKSNTEVTDVGGAYRSREARAVKALENGDQEGFDQACEEGIYDANKKDKTQA